ncbi:MAG: hypothetical protein AAB362_01710 [Patescibacteria group bacterium]
MNQESLRDSERQQQWEERRIAVEAIKGLKGNPVGEPVKESVIGLNLFNVHTVFSGEGRMEDFARVTAPFIDVESLEAKQLRDGFEKNHKDIEEDDSAIRRESAHKQVLLENLKERAKLIVLLDEFYRGREVPYEQRLTIESWKDNTSHITNEGARLQELFDETVRRQKLLEYQKEMRAFGAFLKQKYLSQE